MQTNRTMVRLMLTLFYAFFLLKLVCEEVNVDRFYPVLYPKVSFVL